jgi:hypothetical protein
LPTNYSSLKAIRLISTLLADKNNPKLNPDGFFLSIIRMKGMKQIIVVAVMTVLSITSYAQKHKGHNDFILKHSSELNLSADQSARLAELVREHRTAMQALKQNETLEALEREERLHRLHKEYKEAALAVLTAEQVATLKTLPDYPTRVNGNYMDKKQVQDELNLTEEQTARLKMMQEQNQAEMLKIQQDTSVTEANKKFRLEELKKDRKRELENILTPDQQRKYKEMRNRKPKNDVKQ